MKRVLYLLACLPMLFACTEPVTTSQRDVMIDGNDLHIASGTLNKGRFVSVDNTKKTWVGSLEGGKEKWNARRELLYSKTRDEIEDICGDIFFALRKGPVYTMLDRDETMGGAAPAMGVTVAMAAYLVAEAQTRDENIPTGVYVEFSCQKDEK